MVKENEKKVKERERRKHNPFGAVHRRGRIRRGGQKTSFNREHEYLSSLGAVGFLFASGAADMWGEG